MRTILIVLTLALSGTGVAGQEVSKPSSNSPGLTMQSGDLAEANRLENLASASFSNRDYKDAADLLKKSLMLKEKALGADHPDVATTLHSLANVYYKAGKYNDAEPLYLRAISIRETKLGASHPETIQVLKDFACSRSKNSSRGKPPDPTELDLLKRATCLLADLGVDCPTDGTILIGGVLNGSVTSWTLPRYPKGAQVTQMIQVYVRVNEDGKVIRANAPCGDPLLAKAAVEAASQAMLKPRVVNGKPTQVYGVLMYNFVHE